MSAETSPAELRLHFRQIALRGTLIGVTCDLACVRLHTVPNHIAPPTAGEAADLIAVDRGKVVAALVTVEYTRSGVVSLRFTETGTRSERRSQPRLPVDLPVMLRAVSSTGVRGAWSMGRALDLSTGGLRVLYPACVGKPYNVEISMGLRERGPAERARPVAEPSVRALSPTSRDSGVIRAMCRVANVRHETNGTVELRLAFRALAAESLLMLAAFLSYAAPRQARTESSDAQAA